MNVLVTAGPTREPIDPVRFITNASSGRMGYAVAAEAAAAGHEVTLLTGPVALQPPAGVQVAAFVSVTDLQAALDRHFDACDALVMAAAVGDFSVAAPDRRDTKIRRDTGDLTLTLTPTADLLAGLTARRRADQIIIAFAVADTDDDADAESVARQKLLAKNADYIVVNPPAAMAADVSRAAILSRDGTVADWAERSKVELARQIVAMLGPAGA